MFIYVNMDKDGMVQWILACFCRCECLLLTSVRADGIPQGS